MEMVKTSDKILSNSTGFVPNTRLRGDGAQLKEPFHLVADRTPRRRLQDLRKVVTKELAASYTVKYLPHTGQIVLAAETRVVLAIPPEPTMEEVLIMAVWWIQSLPLSRTEARNVVGSITYSVI